MNRDFEITKAILNSETGKSADCQWSRHIWDEPVTSTWRHGKEREPVYLTRCKRCAAIAARPTLERLTAEIINAA